MTPEPTGPPTGVVPSVVALELIVAQTPRAERGSHVRAGDRVLRPRPGDLRRERGHEAGRVRRHPVDAGDGEWFGGRFADGREATTLDERRLRAPPPGEPLRRPWGAGMTGGRIEQALWLGPLPPAGPLTVIGAWPAPGRGLRSRRPDALDVSRTLGVRETTIGGGLARRRSSTYGSPDSGAPARGR